MRPARVLEKSFDAKRCRNVTERQPCADEDEKIVGWFHTHPRMGVFLSHYDTFLHRNFFPEPWQVALVVEPFSSVAGFFIRQADGTFDPTRYFGFYEMDGANGQSVVRWQNLQKVEMESEGGTPYE